MARPKGIPMSEEAKDLIRQFQKGRTRSPETRARMSVAAKLRSEEHYANSRSPEARAKASAKMKGRKPWHSLRPTTEAFRESRRLINLGRPKSIETRLKMAEARRGEKSHLWKGGLSKEHYRERQNAMQTVEYRLWKEVRLRIELETPVRWKTKRVLGLFRPITFNLGPSFQSCDTSSPTVSACAKITIKGPTTSQAEPSL